MGHYDSDYEHDAQIKRNGPEGIDGCRTPTPAEYKILTLGPGEVAVAVDSSSTGTYPTTYKYDEDKSIDEFARYIAATYGEHYAGNENDIQAFDIWEATSGWEGAEITHQNTAQKYLFRYGKKDGYNRKDIMKTMHYCLMLLHYHNRRK